jgi:hypothetical protein
VRAESNVPAGLTNVVQIATGGSDDLALRADGSLVGWGLNAEGEDKMPAGLTNVVAIAAGFEHTVALKADGTVTAWGYDSFGETNVPAGLGNVVAIKANSYFSLALLGAGPPVLQAPAMAPQCTAGGFQVSLPTQSGRVYRLEYKNSLGDQSWLALPLAAGTGKVLTLADPTAGGAQRFYRVRQW